MAFNSFDAFVAMGGHGPYVWASYFVFFLLGFVLIAVSLKQQKAAWRGLLRRYPLDVQDVPGADVRSEAASADFARVIPPPTTDGRHNAPDS